MDSVNEWSTNMPRSERITSVRFTLKRDVMYASVLREQREQAHRRWRRRLLVMSAGLATMSASLSGATLPEFAARKPVPVRVVQDIPKSVHPRRVNKPTQDLKAAEAALALAQARELRRVRIRLLAETAWGEARGEGTLGMEAVMHVMMNRWAAQELRYGRTLGQVIRKRKAFSARNPNDPNYALIQTLDDLKPGDAGYLQWTNAQRIAPLVYDGTFPDTTGGATFYAAERPGWKPYWRDDMKIVGTMFGHTFYKPKRKGSTYE